jgi:hypothetical protein
MKNKNIETNENYWDCECEINYIHNKKKGNYCPICKTFEEDQPDSRQIEINKSYNSQEDNTIFLYLRKR